MSSESGITGQNWKTIDSDRQLNDELRSAASDKLVVIYFYMPTCSHCLRMTPLVKKHSLDYPKVDFLYTDVHKAADAVEKYRVEYTPTFVLILGGQVVDRIEGEEAQQLENSLKHWNSKSANTRNAARRSSGNLDEYLDKDKLGIQNCKVVIPLHEGLLADKPLPAVLTRVQSEDVNPMLLSVAFTEDVLVESIKIRVPSDFGPRTLHLYANPVWSGQPDFDNLIPDESVIIKPSARSGDVEEHVIGLNKFRKIPVRTITVRALSGLPDYAFAVVERMIFIGRPVKQ